MSKFIIKNSESTATVKISGTAVTETITLNSDLLVANRLVLNGGTQKVTITDILFTGQTGSSFTITRNAVKVFGSVCDQGPGVINFADVDISELEQATSNIVVTTVGECYVYLGLHKVSGYSQTFESAQFSIYDNPSIAGA